MEEICADLCQFSGSKCTFKVPVSWVSQNRSAIAKQPGKSFCLRMMSGAGDIAKVILIKEHSRREPFFDGDIFLGLLSSLFGVARQIFMSKP